jgi:hypothetical protein
MHRTIKYRKKGFTLIIAVICIAAAGSLLVSGTNLFANFERKDNAKQIAVEIADFLKEQSLFKAEIYPVKSAAKPTAANFVIPPADKPVPPDTTPTTETASYTKNAIFYVRNESGVPAGAGYLYFKRPGDADEAVNVFGNAFYRGMIMTLDVSEIYDPVSGEIVVTQTIRLFPKDDDDFTNEVYAIDNTFALVNSKIHSDANHYGRTWVEGLNLIPGFENDIGADGYVRIEIAGKDTPCYYIAAPLP